MSTMVLELSVTEKQLFVQPITCQILGFGVVLDYWLSKMHHVREYEQY
jgi:hypothetical protein